MWYDSAAPAWQLRIELVGAPLPVWRRVVVPKTVGLDDLHDVLIAAMGWDDSHLHLFEDGRKRRYACVAHELEDCAAEHLHALDSVTRVRGRLRWRYDFGDDWLHEVVVEGVAEDVDTTRLPVCVDGAGACPPEDCGGVGGYERLLAILADPGDEEHEAVREWAGGDLDPHAFDVRVVNGCLAALREPDRLGPGWAALDRMRRTGGELSPAERRAVVALGGDAAMSLIDLVRGEAPHAGAATALLHGIGLPAALESVREQLAEFSVDEVSFGDAVDAVAGLGEGLVEPLLEDIELAWRDKEENPDEFADWLESIFAVLMKIGVRDERIFAHAKRLLDVDPFLGAAEIAEYGDPAAIPLLQDRFERLRPSPDDWNGNNGIIEIGAAIEELGGTLTAAQKRKIGAAGKIRRDVLAHRREGEDGTRPFLPARPVRVPERPGRNDPCWCGSARKYKKCHLPADRDGDAESQAAR